MLREFTWCRNRLLLPLIRLLWHRHHRNASFPHGVTALWTRHNDQFGVVADKPPAPMLMGCSSSPCREGIDNWLVHYPTYSYVEHRLQENPTTSVDMLWPKWQTTADMVPHSRHCHTEQSTSMLADCRMQRRREWGTMGAVGQLPPPWSVGHGLASFTYLWPTKTPWSATNYQLVVKLPIGSSPQKSHSWKPIVPQCKAGRKHVRGYNNNISR
jgi:hypothetical protein